MRPDLNPDAKFSYTFPPVTVAGNPQQSQILFMNQLQHSLRNHLGSSFLHSVFQEGQKVVLQVVWRWGLIVGYHWSLQVETQFMPYPSQAPSLEITLMIDSRIHWWLKPLLFILTTGILLYLLFVFFSPVIFERPISPISFFAQFILITMYSSFLGWIWKEGTLDGIFQSLLKSSFHTRKKIVDVAWHATTRAISQIHSGTRGYNP